MKDLLGRLQEQALALGAYKAGVVKVADISVDASFRSLCEANSCGNYGKNYMCPPDIGDIGELMAELKTYELAMVYQTVEKLEDSYDFEGMMDAGKKHNDLAQKLREWANAAVEEALGQGDRMQILHLGAGGCRVCPVCGRRTGEPCRFPEKAIGSLEAYGVNVSLLAEAAGMRSINGQDTVTYFGAILCRKG